MENVKIKVNSEAESKEVQELFFNLGFEWKDSGNNIVGFSSKYCFYYTENGFLLKTDSHRVFKLLDSMQITIEQLRDMVALKRNDDKTEAFDNKEMCEGGSKPKHSHYKKGVAHLNVIDPYRIADLYDLHPCAEHIMKKSLCAVVVVIKIYCEIFRILLIRQSVGKK